MNERCKILRMIIGGWKLKAIKSQYKANYHKLITDLHKEFKNKVHYYGSHTNGQQRLAPSRKEGISWRDS